MPAVQEFCTVPQTPFTRAPPTATEVDFEALGPTPFPQVSVKVAERVRTPEFLLTTPLTTDTGPRLLPFWSTMVQVMVPPPVMLLPVRRVDCSLWMDADWGVNEPMATFARQAVPLQVVRGAQEAAIEIESWVNVLFLIAKVSPPYFTVTG